MREKEKKRKENMEEERQPRLPPLSVTKSNERENIGNRPRGPVVRGIHPTVEMRVRSARCTVICFYIFLVVNSCEINIYIKIIMNINKNY